MQDVSESVLSNEYHGLLRKAVLDPQGFVRATFSGQRKGGTLEWVKVTLRPVQIKGQRQIQFAYYDDKKCITKNYLDADLAIHLDDLLNMAFKHIHVATVTGDLQVNFNKSGKPSLHRTKPSHAGEAPETAPHDRQKDLLLPEGKPDPYLQAIGFMTAEGQIRADRQKKFRQINEFIKLLQQIGAFDHFEKAVTEIVDCGCGNAYLTFALYHYLNDVLKQPVRMTGVDVRGELTDKHLETARALGWEGLTFAKCAIAEFVPAVSPDITLALHACDTATDEALAQGIAWGSQLIVSVPCCHHHLQEQLRRQSPSAEFRPIFRHGILAERQGDLVTDGFRALILRIMGYHTEVLQFISAEHTAKNLMIRAVRSDPPVPPAFVEEYRRMKAYWQVTPRLEELLGEPFQHKLG